MANPVKKRRREQVEPRARQFVADYPIRPARCEGKEGILIRLLLPSYRSLPLSCIYGIDITIDREAVERNCTRLILNGYTHRLDELAALSTVFWFILDYADFFVERSLAPGLHTVAGRMLVVEPYMTVGRFPFIYEAERTLLMEQEQRGSA